MNLSQLVALRNNLQDLNFTKLLQEVEVLDAAVSSNNNLQVHTNYKESLNKLVSFFSAIENNLDSVQNSIEQFIFEIDKEINELTAPMMKLGYQINGYFGSNLTNWDVERNDRKLDLSDEERSEINTVIRSYTNWKYPTLEIGPGDGEWTESLVAADPLYIIDRHQEFLDSTLNKFNPIYRKRVRSYLTGLHANRPEFDYSMLPQNQFGFIYAWNVVNFWPYEETKHVLAQCFNLLKPGGSMLFSFNNCDIVQCAEYAETGYKSYLTPKLLNNIFQTLGFLVKQYRSTSISVHWVEIQKPGNLITTKRHQTLGKIISVKPAQEVDDPQEKVYTNEEIKKLKQEAIDLNIDTADKINNAYRPVKLEYLINQKRKNK